MIKAITFFGLALVLFWYLLLFKVHYEKLFEVVEKNITKTPENKNQSSIDTKAKFWNYLIKRAI